MGARGREGSCDRIEGLWVYQPDRGPRVSVDSLLVASFAGRRQVRGAAIELGAGSGVISMLLAQRHGWRSVVALELQPGLCELAHKSVALNRLEAFVQVLQGDLREVQRRFAKAEFAAAVCNPPFGATSEGSPSPIHERAVANSELSCTVTDVAQACGHLLRPGGRLFLVQHASRCAATLRALSEEGLAAAKLRFVHAKAESPASRVLLEAVKHGRERLEILSPLILDRAFGSRSTGPRASYVAAP